MVLFGKTYFMGASVTTTEKVISSGSKLSSVAVFEPLQMCRY
jgi:hypothetical protein